MPMPENVRRVAETAKLLVDAGLIVLVCLISPFEADRLMARELFEDARQLLQRIIDGHRLTARGVYGFFPANSVGDDIEVYTDESRSQVLTTIHTLRQQMEKAEDGVGISRERHSLGRRSATEAPRQPRR